MEDSSSDGQQTTPADGQNSVDSGANQVVANADSEGSSGIGTTSSINSDILSGNQSGSIGSSDIRILPLFDIFANALSSTGAITSGTDTLPNSSNKSSFAAIITGTTTATTVDNTVNEDDIRTKWAKPPAASRPGSGPPVVGAIKSLHSGENRIQ